MKKGGVLAAAAAAVAVAVVAAILTGDGPASSPFPHEPRQGPRPPLPEDRVGPVAAAPAGEAAGPPAEERPRDADPPGPVAEPVEPKAVVLEGLVVGTRDEPLEGAEVLLFTGREDAAGTSFPREPVRRAAADGEGRFRIETTPVAFADLEARAPGRRPARTGPFALEGSVAGIVLRPGPAASLEGVVLGERDPQDPGGPDPLAGALVELRRSPERPRCALVRTDADGRFRLEGLEPGTGWVFAHAEGFLSGWASIRGIPGGPVEITLRRGVEVSLSGQVLLPDGSGPASGVRVSAQVMGESRFPSPPAGAPSGERSATTGARGEFRIDGLRIATTRGGALLRVDLDGGDRGSQRVFLREWPGNTHEVIRLAPPPSARVEGRLFHRGFGGEPLGLARATLLLTGATRDPLDPSRYLAVQRRIVTGRDGSFLVEDAPERYLAITLSPELELEWEFPGSKGPAERGPLGPEGWSVEVEVLPRGSIAGVVYDPDGLPVAGARVTVSGAAAAALTDAEGAYTVGGVSSQSGSGFLAVRAEAHGFVPTDFARVALLPGMAVRGVILHFGGRTLAITGRVVDRTGRGIPRIPVARTSPGTAAPDDSRRARPGDITWTDTDGAWRFEVGAGTAHRVTAYPAGREPAFVDPVKAGEDAPDMVVPEPDEAPGEGR